jgi:hypothetical protein
MAQQEVFILTGHRRRSKDAAYSANGLTAEPLRQQTNFK